MYMMSSPVRTAEKLPDGDSLCVFVATMKLV